MNESCTTTIDLRNGTSLSRFLYLPSEKIIFTIIWPCVMFVGLTGNIAFVWTVKRVSSLHTSTYIFLSCLSCTDIGILIGLGVSFIPDALYNPIRFETATTTKVIVMIITWCCFLCSFSFVTLVSVERFFAICHPIKHHLLKGFKRTLKLIFIVVVFNIVAGLMTLLYHFEYISACILWPNDPAFSHYSKAIDLSVLNYLHNGQLTQIGDIFASCLMSLFAVSNCFMYVRILQELRRRKNSKVLHSSAEVEKTIRQASITVIANGSVFCFCTTILTMITLINVLYSIFQIDVFGVGNVVGIRTIAFSVMVLNASVNPLIYLVVNHRYRHAVMTSFTNICPRN